MLSMLTLLACTGTKDVGGATTDLAELTTTPHEVDSGGDTGRSTQTPSTPTAVGPTGPTGSTGETGTSPTGRDTASGCGEQAPLIARVVTTPVPDRDPSTPEVEPALAFDLELRDSDGGLHALDVHYWVDRQVDGVVDVSQPPSVSGILTGEAPCTVDELSLTFTVGFGDGHGNDAEVALQVVGADGRASNTVIGSGCVPLSDGSLCP